MTRASTAMWMVVAALALGGAGVAAAQGSATEQVRETVDQVIHIVEDPALRGPAHERERRARMREVVLKRFGFDEMARRAMGPNWRSLSSAQQQEYTRLFTDLLERSYLGRIEGYGGEAIRYDGESVEGQQAEVRSTITGRNNDKTSIVYRLVARPEGYQVYDLVIDGVSLVNNYRSQFGQILRNSGTDALLTRMRNKLETEQGDPP